MEQKPVVIRTRSKAAFALVWTSSTESPGKAPVVTGYAYTEESARKRAMTGGLLVKPIAGGKVTLTPFEVHRKHGRLSYLPGATADGFDARSAECECGAFWTETLGRRAGA